MFDYLRNLVDRKSKWDKQILYGLFVLNVILVMQDVIDVMNGSKLGLSYFFIVWFGMQAVTDAMAIIQKNKDK